MNTYVITLNQAAKVVIEGEDRRTAAVRAGKAIGVEVLNFNGKQASKKAVAAALAEGAIDLRAPKIATVENRRALGNLVGM